MPTQRRIEKFSRIANLRDLDAAVVLEDIHDPHNAAAAFRSCDAFGIQNVHLVFEREKPFNPRREGKKTSGYTNKWLDFHIHHGTEEAMEKLKTQGFTLIATRVDPTARPLPTFDLAAIERPAFVFGNEHRGISEMVERAADHLTFIPMIGLAESFNLSVSVSLVLYEYFSQRRLGRGPVTARPEERAGAGHDDLLQRWLARMDKRRAGRGKDAP